MLEAPVGFVLPVFVILPEMVLLRLTCCCFLVWSVESRGKAGEPVTRLQVHDEGVIMHEIANQYEIREGKNLGHWLMAVDRVDQNHTLGWRSEDKADETKIEVDKMKEKEVEAAVRAGFYAKMKTKAVKHALGDAEWPNPKRQPRVKKVPTSKKITQSQYEVINKATDTETKVTNKTGSELGARKEGEAKSEAEIKTLPDLSTGVNTVLRSELKTSEEAILQANVGFRRVQVLQTRGFPDSISEAFKHSTSRLLKPGGMVDIGMRTVQPYVEWMKTACRNLPIDYGLLTSAFRRLTSLGSGLGNKAGSGTATPKPKHREFWPVDLGLKTLVGDRQINIKHERNKDGVAVPVRYEHVETQKIPPKPTKTSPRISPEPSRKSPPGLLKEGPKLSHKELKGSNGKGSNGGGTRTVSKAREEIGEPITPPQSPLKSSKELPPASMKESPSKTKKGGFESGVLREKTWDDADVGEDFSAPKMPAHSQRKSPPKSEPIATRKSPPERRKGENGSAVSRGESDRAGKDIRAPRTPPESPPESRKKSPPKDKQGLNQDEVGGKTSRFRFAVLDHKKMKEMRESYTARHREAGLASDDEEDRPPIVMSSSDFREKHVNLPNDWKLLDQQYGKQKG